MMKVHKAAGYVVSRTHLLIADSEATGGVESQNQY